LVGPCPSVGYLPQSHLRARCEIQQCQTALLPSEATASLLWELCGTPVLALGAFGGAGPILGAGEGPRPERGKEGPPAQAAGGGQVEGRGACRHPDGSVRLLRSALRAFPLDLEAHLGGRPCPASLGAGVVAVPGAVPVHPGGR